MVERRLPGLLLVTDRRLCASSIERTLLEHIELCLEAGVRWVWFREKDMPRNARIQLAYELASIVHHYQGNLILSNTVEDLIETCADGIHFSSDTPFTRIRQFTQQFPNSICGYSAHADTDWNRVDTLSLTYATISPVFTVCDRENYGPSLGPRYIEHIPRVLTPCYALGGVNVQTLSQLSPLWKGVAIRSALMTEDDPMTLILSALETF